MYACSPVSQLSTYFNSIFYTTSFSASLFRDLKSSKLHKLLFLLVYGKKIPSYAHKINHSTDFQNSKEDFYRNSSPVFLSAVLPLSPFIFIFTHGFQPCLEFLKEVSFALWPLRYEISASVLLRWIKSETFDVM